MDKSLLTKIIFLISLVDLGALGTSRVLEMTATPPEGDGITPPGKNRPAKATVEFHNLMGEGLKVQVHPHSNQTDWGAHELEDNGTGYIEFAAQPGVEVQAEFTWKHGESSGNVFLFDRDSKRCSRWNCHWMITTLGISGVDSMGKTVVFYDWLYFATK